MPLELKKNSKQCLDIKQKPNGKTNYKFRDSNLK